jgi:hypothetical protein
LLSPACQFRGVLALALGRSLLLRAPLFDQGCTPRKHPVCSAEERERRERKGKRENRERKEYVEGCVACDEK